MTLEQYLPQKSCYHPFDGSLAFTHYIYTYYVYV